jgi:hypothetical protein
MVKMLHEEVPFMNEYLAVSLEDIDNPEGHEKNQRGQEILSVAPYELSPAP